MNLYLKINRTAKLNYDGIKVLFAVVHGNKKQKKKEESYKRQLRANFPSACAHENDNIILWAENKSK